MGIRSEFRDFILRGKVVDLAVGVAVGGAFTKVIDSLVKEVVMPIVGLVTSGVDFSQLKIVIKAANRALNTPEVAISYGIFINSVLSFLLVGAVVFALIKFLNQLHLKAQNDESTKTEQLLGEIRDIMLKANQK